MTPLPGSMSTFPPVLAVKIDKTNRSPPKVRI